MDGKRNNFKTNKVPVHSRKRIDVDGLCQPPPKGPGEKDELYFSLWHACAGPVCVPRAGEKVVYFPQGHMEQVEPYMNQDGTMEMPIYNLPSKILCRVMHVQLKAEAGTDEVFAQIVLLPEAEQDVLSMEHRNYQALPRKVYSGFLSKKLTLSDTGAHGGYSVPKRHADDGCLPTLDMSQKTPRQELVARDLHGFEWPFRHTYRGRPKRHLLTGGWSAFVTSKKIVAGDTFILLRGENGELGVGVRRAKTGLLNSISTSVMSGHSMRHGILASAFHAFSTRSMFTVYYHPWTSSSEFMIPLDQYMKYTKLDYSVGTRFGMKFEGECCEQRALGTIIRIEDADHIRWPNSEWRCLKVIWDPTHPTPEANLRPERVCPWHIEPIEVTAKKKSLMHQQKRARTEDASPSGFPSLLMDGMWHMDPVKYESQSSSGVLQGQDDDSDVNKSCAQRQPIPSLILPQNPSWALKQPQIKNQLEVQIPIYNSVYQSTSNATLFSGGKVASLGLQNNWPPMFSYRVDNNGLASRKFSIPNVNSHELRNENESSHSDPNGGHRYMLFGVDLVKNSTDLPSPQVVTSSEHESLCSIPPTSQSSVSEPLKIKSSKQCNNCCSRSNRSCTKVLKHGTALGRSVDLTRFDGYESFISELDQMFDFEGRLIDGTSGWYVSYTDYDGDMMLIGDYPWEKFQYEVQRMLICPKEEIERLNNISPNTSTSP